MRPGIWPFIQRPCALVDSDFAKDQLLLMLRSFYLHPNGQIPAYEWNFGDVNPPVHAWATLRLFNTEKALGRSDLRFLERSFQGLMRKFQLVGEPERSLREKRVRGRLPGAGQHWRIRPECATPYGRIPGASRRDGMDGVLLPVHAGYRPDSLRLRLDVRRGSLHLPTPFRADFLCDGPHRRAR